MFKIVFVVLFFSYNLIYAQPPKPCRDLLPGYSYIPETVLGGIDKINCGATLTGEVKLLDNLGQIDQADVFFGIDDTFDLNSATSGVALSHTNSTSFSFPQGLTWVLMKGKMAGNSVITCKSYELLPINQPVVKTDLCAGNLISLDIKDDYIRDKFRIDWGDGSVEDVTSGGTSTISNHTYSSFYGNIKVQAFYEREDSGVCMSDAFVINRDVAEPMFLSALEGLNDATEVRIKYVGNPVIKYNIEGQEEGSNSWQNVSVAEAGEGQVIGLNAQQKYCFRLKTENSCGESFYSQNTLCTIVIDREVLTSSSLRIHWNKPSFPSEDPSQIRLQKKNTSGTPEDQVLGSATATEFIDQGLVCGQKYFYQVEASYPPVAFQGNPISVMIRTSYIGKEISEAKINAKPPYMAMASFDGLDDTKLNFTVGIDNGGLIDTFTYYKSHVFDGTYQEVLKTKANVYSETGGSIDSKNHCFKYQIKDICGVLTAPSDPFCTVGLNGLKKDSLNWTPFIAPSDIFLPNSQPLYNIEYFNEATGTYELINSVFSDTTFYIGDFIDNLTDPTVKLRVLLNQNFPLGPFNNFAGNLYSNSILHTFSPRIFAPSVFTPNGSGPTETENFKVFSKFVKSGNYKILDRFGNLLFVSKDMLDTWDGYDQKAGSPVSVGTYFYIINAISYDDKSVNVKGSISVLK